MAAYNADEIKNENDVKTSDYRNDMLSETAKYADSLYELQMLENNSYFYGVLRNFVIGLIIILLSFRVGLINAKLSYAAAAIITIIACLFVFSTMRYTTDTRDRARFEEIIGKSYA
jgi:hypothetical protein